MRALTKSVFLLLLVNSVSFGQSFIPVDSDTFEIIDGVKYSLYKDKRVVCSDVTLSDEVTTIMQDIVFDSIAFSRIDYETRGFVMSNIDSIVFLSKKIIYLDEMVIGSKKDAEIILGETNRFIKRRSAALNKDLVYGLLFSNGSPQELQLDKMAFYVDRVKLKTAYRINFSHVSEIFVDEGHHFAEPDEMIYVTDTLYLNPKDKNRVEVRLPADFYLPSTGKMFVWIQLLGYYDEKGVIVAPELD